MKEYLQLFIDQEYPPFIDKYLKTKTLERIKSVSQFCGCNYTTLYSPSFFYSRYDHSLVVAHMTWHFTHDKKQTIAALLHDVGTPCFAHSIDYVFGDFLKQESSEKDIIDIIKKDKELLNYLEEDGIILEDLQDLSHYPILENQSPKLCTDRLDGVLYTCYIWLHTHSLEEIKEVYDDIVILTNEEKTIELGFKSKEICEKFVKMVFIYAKELQGNRDKYVMHYISELVKNSVSKMTITLDNLYQKKESEIISIFENHFTSWEYFKKATKVICTNDLPQNFYVSISVKKRNVLLLVKEKNKSVRISKISNFAENIYKSLDDYQDTLYGYINEIEEL